MSEREAKEHRKRSLERKLAAYSAAAGASLLAAAGAEAQTIYTDFPDTTLVTNTPIYLDLNQDGPPGLALDALDDLLLKEQAPVGKAGKGEGVLAYLWVNPIVNTYMYGFRILGNYPTCYVASVLPQSACSSAPPADCDLLAASSFGAAAKGGAIVLNNYIPVVPSVNDQFIRIGGSIVASSTEAGKKQGVPLGWEGWIRVNVQLATGKTSGDSSPFNIIVKDHAIFINPGGTTSCDATSLPVDFVSFDAHFDAGTLELSWETASEINNAGFEVQFRAADQDAFLPVGFVEGAGTTTTPQSYSHRVEGLEPGKYVFRLKQIDLDGAFKYTDQLEVTVEVPGTHYLSDAYPNPFNPQASFTLVVPTEQAVRVELFDATGRSVAVLYDDVAAADTPIRMTIRGEDLPSGTYLYRATGETFSEAKKVVLAK